VVKNFNTNQSQAIAVSAVTDASRPSQVAASGIIPSMDQQTSLFPQPGHFSHDISPQQPLNHKQRVLTSSSSFDSKSNIPNFSSFNMSAEAARLFQTLQQSPLPQNDVINYC
jgi:hypothetical protein